MSAKRLFGLFIFVSLLAAPLLTVQSANASVSYSNWSQALSIEALPGSSLEVNTSFLDGCPILSRDGLQLYIASNRPDGQDLDIWVAERASPEEGFGTPVNLGAPINSEFNDFCPSPLRNGHGFMFVSNRPGGCGGADIYITRYDPENGWREPVNLGCEVNSPADEAGPVLSFSEAGPPTLYFSSTRLDGPGGANIYMSQKSHDWLFAPAQLVPGVNSDSNDIQPSIRRDGRELVFASNRPGSAGMDIWAVSRDTIAEAWSNPTNLGPTVNSAADETRPSLSWDGTMLLFGSTRTGEGASDIYFSTRDRY